MNARSDLHLAALAEAAGAAYAKGSCEGFSGAIGFLLQKAAPNLSRADLLALRDECFEAEDIASRAARVASGVACLVMTDAGPHGGHAGNFQSGHDVPELLLHFAGTFDHLAALSRLGAEVASLLDAEGGAA